LFDDDGGGDYWDDADDNVDCMMTLTMLVLEVILNGSEERDITLTWKTGGISIRCQEKCIQIEEGVGEKVLRGEAHGGAWTGQFSSFATV